MKLFILLLTTFYSFSVCAKHSRHKHREELTDNIFPRTDPQIIGMIYHMLEVIDLLFTKHNIPYWIDGGTALGAIRHQGCIPWDDDADLVFHIKDRDRILALKDAFAQFTLYLEETDIIRLYASKETKHPYVDIAGYKLCPDNTYRFDLQSARDTFKRFYWLPREIDTLVRVQFGPLMLSAPNDMMRYIFTGYGADCLTHATFQTPHGGSGTNLKISNKVRIVDFSSAVYEDFYVPLAKETIAKKCNSSDTLLRRGI